MLKKSFACIVIQVDDFDVFKERMLGSGDKKPRPHKRALLFVDNSGADVVLGMLPLARELLQRGTEVSLLFYDASEKRLLNDLCATHHFVYSGCFGCELPSCTK
jgi:type II pantothenate kinase